MVKQHIVCGLIGSTTDEANQFLEAGWTVVSVTKVDEGYIAIVLQEAQSVKTDHKTYCSDEC